ncbi:ketoacyl-ACP synthase III [Vallitalea guaymasensis]|uniref:Ketoacyl-ACP synthase III n=1 Tax=Vallitalea guaymasensis TaxID=1185412 RepID=A0A8J8MCW4_9FIRM|nr:ketoacyl-ACP synthase III [Vallitalea guaymasensis]QUH30719.1 ketoacyl-ACP synthase III [Vallitalea guaymasensis]
MKNTNINIIGVGTYHPKNKVSNNELIAHFNKLGIEIQGLLTHLEREYRYLSDDKDETVISMAYEASINALAQAKMKPEDIDIIVFATDTPEYTSPSNAIKLTDLLKADNAKMVYDTNSNCIGMLTALDQVSRILQTNKRFKRALVVGGLLISSVVNTNDPVTYGNFGDSAAAVILEKVEEDIKRGFIDSTHYTKTSEVDNILMPKIGYSKITKGEKVTEEDKKWTFVPFESDFISDYWVELIKDLARENGMQPTDVDHFLFSQFTNPAAKATLEKLQISSDKLTYVGNEYGYTGVTSPIMALERALEKGRITEGSKVILISVGSGSTATAILFKF